MFSLVMAVILLIAAIAASQINVPQTVFAGSDGNAGNALGTVDQFMQMMTVSAAKSLHVDPTITK